MAIKNIENGVYFFDKEFQDKFISILSEEEKRKLWNMIKEEASARETDYRIEEGLLVINDDNLSLASGEYCNYIRIPPDKSGVYIGEAKDDADYNNGVFTRQKGEEEAYKENKKLQDKFQTYKLKEWDFYYITRYVSQDVAFAIEKAFIRYYDAFENGLNGSYGQGLDGVHDCKTEEHCQKIAEGNTGTKKSRSPILAIDLKKRDSNGKLEVGKPLIFDSQREAAEFTKVKQPNISTFCNKDPQKSWIFFNKKDINDYKNNDKLIEDLDVILPYVEHFRKWANEKGGDSFVF